nr:PREDICTED: juvenile hormone acid O-methyltransferase-like [Bemisia tabaci]
MLEGNLYLDFNQSNPNNFKDSEDLLADHKSLFRWFSEEVVLDVGCGPGDVTRHVLYPWLPENANKTVLGVDVSPVMKDLGNKKFGHPDVFFETFDISSKNLAVITEDEKFRDGFTKIFSFHVFHWIDDLELAFENVYKLLRPGGQVLLTFPVSRQYQRLYKQMQEREPWSKMLKGAHREIPNYFLNGDPITEFLSIVTKVGFKVVSCKLITTHDEFPSIEALKKLVGSLDIHFNKIPTNLRGQYLEECIEIMRQKNLKELDNGTAVVTEKRITAFLEK